MPDTDPRSRGGQPGNTNALKHGFYTRRIPGLKNIALEALDTEFPGFEEEIFLLRAYIRRILEACSTGTTVQDNILLLRTICMSFSTLTRLTREHRAMTAQPIDTLASLRQAHTGVLQIQHPLGVLPEMVGKLLEAFPEITADEYYGEVEGTLPEDTFDSQPPAPFPTPVTLCAPQAVSPEQVPDAPAVPPSEAPSPAPHPVAASQPRDPSVVPTGHPAGRAAERAAPVGPSPTGSSPVADPLRELTNRINQDLIRLSAAQSRRSLAHLIEQLAVPGSEPIPPPSR